LLTHDGNGKEFDVFISHSSVDQPYVAFLATSLEAAGISVWFDKTTMERETASAVKSTGASSPAGTALWFSQRLSSKRRNGLSTSSMPFRQRGAGEEDYPPIWHGITRDDLIEYSPAFADRRAKNSMTDSYAEIIESLLSMLGRPNPARSSACSGRNAFEQERETQFGDRFIALSVVRFESALEAPQTARRICPVDQRIKLSAVCHWSRIAVGPPHG
jgi:hypothetical protein